MSRFWRRRKKGNKIYRSKVTQWERKEFSSLVAVFLYFVAHTEKESKHHQSDALKTHQPITDHQIQSRGLCLFLDSFSTVDSLSTLHLFRN